MKHAMQKGADVYVASSAKTVEGNERAFKALSATAKTYQIPTLQVNCVGTAGGSVKAGASAVWNPDGSLLEQMGDEEEGLLFYDMDTGRAEVVLY